MEGIIFADFGKLNHEGILKHTLVNLDLLAWAEWVESVDDSTEDASKSSIRIFLQGVSNPVVLHGEAANSFIQYIIERMEDQE